MRRVLPLALLLVFPLLLAACGGSDDGDDATPTTAPPGVTSTSAAAVTATGSSGNLPAATGTTESGSGSGSGPGSGTGATATPGGEAGATPTRRPATVVSTPRPIATQDAPLPTTAPEPDATATELPPTPVPATLEPGQLAIVLEETFDSGTSDYFEVGAYDYATTEIVAGSYVVTPAAESWQTITVSPDDSWNFNDGQIVADFSMEGNGEFGLVARSAEDDAGLFHFYVCWLTPSGAAGCSAYHDGTFTELMRVDDPALFQSINNVLMQVIGTELIFEVNGVQIGAIDDSSVVGGFWGIYAWGDANIATIRIDSITIAVP